MTIEESVKKGIEYIETHIHGEIRVADVANAVSYSQFYFSREFARLTHLSVYEYILRRKLSCAYLELMEKKEKIVDIALRYGFSSHEGFSRAFRKMVGKNPSETLDCRQLVILQPIDDAYFGFLCELKVERLCNPVADCWFEIEGGSGGYAGKELLYLLSGADCLECGGILKGRSQLASANKLCIPLRNLYHKLRVYHPDSRLSLRYYIEHDFSPDELGCNYLLARCGKTFVDIYEPLSNPEQQQEKVP